MVFWFLDRKQASRIRRPIEAPILIVSGGMDRIVRPRVARALLRRYPLASFRFFPASGHWLFHEIGQRRVFDEVGDWIETLGERFHLLGGEPRGHHQPHRAVSGVDLAALSGARANQAGDSGRGDSSGDASGSSRKSEGEPSAPRV